MSGIQYLLVSIAMLITAYSILVLKDLINNKKQENKSNK